MAKANTVDTVIAAVAVDTAAPVELTPEETVVLARRASAEAVGRAYGADRAYAVALNNLLAPKWYEEGADSITDLGKVVKAEKKLYFAALKAYAPKHSNPSNNWRNIRKYGKQEAEGEPEKGEGEGEGDGGEGEGGEGGDTRMAPLQDRLIGFLHSAYKAYHRDETPNQACRDSIGSIKAALLSLGMDVDADPEAESAEGESDTPDF